MTVAASQILFDKIKDERLKAACFKLAQDYPASAETLNALISHFDGEDSSHVSKKRKMTTASEFDLSNPICILQGATFLQPRKKRDLVVYSTHLEVCSLVSSDASEIQLKSPGDIVRYRDYVLPVKDISRVLLLPTPNKTQKNSTLVILSRNPAVEHVMFSFNVDKPMINISWFQKAFAASNSDSAVTHLFGRVLSLPIKSPSSSNFLSRASNLASKELAMYANCHLRTKDGHLYFMDEGMFFGFKKPFFFLEKQNIRGVDVIGMTTRTFDIQIAYDVQEDSASSRDVLAATNAKPDEDGTVLVQFSMLDHSEHDAFAQYVKRQGLVRQTSKPDKKPARSDSSLEAPVTFNNYNDDNYDEDADEDFACSDDDDSSGSGDDSSDADEKEDEAGDDDDSDETDDEQDISISEDDGSSESS